MTRRIINCCHVCQIRKPANFQLDMQRQYNPHSKHRVIFKSGALKTFFDIEVNVTIPICIKCLIEKLPNWMRKEEE
jgi:hypothetical protein